MLKGPLLINSRYITYDFLSLLAPIDYTLILALVTASFRHYIYAYIYFTSPQGFQVKYLTK